MTPTAEMKCLLIIPCSTMCKCADVLVILVSGIGELQLQEVSPLFESPQLQYCVVELQDV